MKKSKPRTADYNRGNRLRVLWALINMLDVPRTAMEISDHTGLHIRRVYRWMQAGIEEGIIETVGDRPTEYVLKRKH